MGYWGDLKDDDEGMAPAPRQLERRPPAPAPEPEGMSAEQLDLVELRARVEQHEQALQEAEQAIGELANGFERCAIAFNGLNQHRLRQHWWIVALVIMVSLQWLWIAGAR